jgi:FMN-dependent NADH-azoreductase
LQESHLTVFFTPAEKRTSDDMLTIRHSEKAVADLMGADARFTQKDQ